MGPSLTEFGPMFVDSGPSFVDFGAIVVELGWRHFVDPGQLLSSPARRLRANWPIWIESAPTYSAHLTRCRQTSTGAAPISAVDPLWAISIGFGPSWATNRGQLELPKQLQQLLKQTRGCSNCCGPYGICFSNCRTMPRQIPDLMKLPRKLSTLRDLRRQLLELLRQQLLKLLRQLRNLLQQLLNQLHHLMKLLQELRNLLQSYRNNFSSCCGCWSSCWSISHSC